MHLVDEDPKSILNVILYDYVLELRPLDKVEVINELSAALLRAVDKAKINIDEYKFLSSKTFKVLELMGNIKKRIEDEK